MAASEAAGRWFESSRARQFQRVYTGHIGDGYTGDMAYSFGTKGFTALSIRHVSCAPLSNSHRSFKLVSYDTGVLERGAAAPGYQSRNDLNVRTQAAPTENSRAAAKVDPQIDSHNAVGSGPRLRQSVGVIDICAAKTRPKCELSLKPQEKAMSVTVR